MNFTGGLRWGRPRRTLAVTRLRLDHPQLGAVRPIARLAHVARAPRRAVQEVDPRFSWTCSARTGEPDGLRTVWGWKPELPRPHRKRFSLGGGQGKRNGEVNSPTPGSRYVGGPSLFGVAGRRLLGWLARIALRGGWPFRPQGSASAKDVKSIEARVPAPAGSRFRSAPAGRRPGVQPEGSESGSRPSGPLPRAPDHRPRR